MSHISNEMGDDMETAESVRRFCPVGHNKQRLLNNTFLQKFKLEYLLRISVEPPVNK